MATFILQGVLRDGSVPSVDPPADPRFTIQLSREENLEVALTVVRLDGSLVSLLPSGGNAGPEFYFRVRRSSVQVGPWPGFLKTSVLERTRFGQPTALFTATPADWQALPNGRFVYDIRFVTAGGGVVVPLSPFVLVP